MNKTVLGIFDSTENAEYAIDDLKDLGYNPRDMSLMVKDMKEVKRIRKEAGADLAEGAVTGLATGGIIGGIAGLLVGTGAIPGLGALLIGGPLAIALGLNGAVAITVSGAATGALAGGIIGVLAKLGVSKEDAKIYEERIRNGAMLLAVPVYEDEEDEVKMVLENHDATDIKTISDRLGEYRAMDDEEMMDEEEIMYPRPQDRYREPAFVGVKGGRARKSRGRTVRRKRRLI